MPADPFFGAPNYPSWVLVRWISDVEQWRNEAWSLCDPQFSERTAVQHMKLAWKYRMSDWLGEHLSSPFTDMTLHAYDLVDWKFVVAAFRERGHYPKTVSEMGKLWGERT
jgi:hypothetical protein